MAFLPGVAAQFARSAVGALGSAAIRGTAWVQSGAPSQAAAIARVLAKDWGSKPGWSMQQAVAIAQSVIRAARSGDLMEQNPSRVFGAAELTRDREILPGQPRYLYRAIVTRSNPDGSETTSMVRVPSDQALSSDQIDTLIRASDPIAVSPPPPPRPGQPTTGYGEITNVRIVSAGVR